MRAEHSRNELVCNLAVRQKILLYHHTHTLSLTHTHTHSLSHTHTLSLSHTHTLSLSHTHTLSLTHTHTHSLSHTHTHTLSLTHIQRESLVLPASMSQSLDPTAPCHSIPHVPAPPRLTPTLPAVALAPSTSVSTLALHGGSAGTDLLLLLFTWRNFG